MIYRWKESCAQPQQSLKTLCFSSWTGRSSSNRNPSFNCITLFRSLRFCNTPASYAVLLLKSMLTWLLPCFKVYEFAAKNK